MKKNPADRSAGFKPIPISKEWLRELRWAAPSDCLPAQPLHTVIVRHWITSFEIKSPGGTG